MHFRRTRILSLILFAGLAVYCNSAAPAACEAAASEQAAHTVYDFTPIAINGKPFPLAHYKGKILLIVNTASKCGYTAQYHDLEDLYKEYKDRGFEVLAFPSNDFAGQEPGSDADIKKFCTLNYGVTFQIFSRAPVSGDSKQPLFKYLTEGGNRNIQGEIAWNFEKFLIGREGKVQTRFGSYVNPESPRVKDAIEKLLAEKAR